MAKPNPEVTSQGGAPTPQFLARAHLDVVRDGQVVGVPGTPGMISADQLTAKEIEQFTAMGVLFAPEQLVAASLQG